VPRHPGGALSAWGAPIPVDALTPFADPKLCLPPPGTDRTAVISAARAVANVVVFVWQAVAVAISFLEAPPKFRARVGRNNPGSPACSGGHLRGS